MTKMDLNNVPRADAPEQRLAPPSHHAAHIYQKSAQTLNKLRTTKHRKKNSNYIAPEGVDLVYNKH